MNEKVLKQLEFDKILNKLSDLASTQEAKGECAGLKPVNDLSLLNRMQQENEDALNRIFKIGTPVFGGIKNIRQAVLSTRQEFILSTRELMDTASTLESCRQLKAYGGDDNDSLNDCLSDLFYCLDPLPQLVAAIRRCILTEDEIADDASSELKDIRRKIKLSNDRIRSELNSMINGSYKTFLMEPVITLRNGRFCLPVKAECKNQVPGMVHDTSSTGSTLFIEPASSVKLNNDIKELMLAEKQEIQRILSELSIRVAENSEQITANLDILKKLDFIFSRARLAADMDAMRPVYSDDLSFDLKKARHPLINKKTVVPIDVYLGKAFDQLVITGPNTGGKTVTLKTVGLIHIMGLSGLFIPTADNSVIGLYSEIFADIGDEQSIEQSLSTFSSHMTNIVKILRSYTKDSLCLFDELGAGTDPEEGAALAQAVLNFLHVRKINTMATTHYSELKIYALNTEGIENASQEFDVESLKPTYHLLIGVPGKSNAFAISRKLGLPGYVIEEAERRMDDKDAGFEAVVEKLEAARQELENVRKEAVLERESAKKTKDELEHRYSRLEKESDRIIKDAKQEAKEILQKAKKEADETLRDIQKYGGSDKEGIKKLEADRRRLRESINSGNEANEKKDNVKAGIDPSRITIGMEVEIVSSGFKGTVATRPDPKGNLVVLCGIIKYRTNCSELIETVIKDPYEKKPHNASKGSALGHAMTISTELNIIGQTTSDGIAELHKYLDDAYMSHLTEVRIVHGKGTGALRTAVREALKKIKYVDSFRSGEYGEGDAGVTIVKFK
ncbi:MAG: endonuclease MutS2 [Lachnospiraceae bacterium]|nr:endonuclease MutS2 [Lachnospiraceae bacterium]